jgi:sugar O-acyltransferase (sialic acid O-acetyltransferase NeuD family)
MSSGPHLLVFGVGGHASAVVEVIRSRENDFRFIFVNNQPGEELHPLLDSVASDFVLEKDLVRIVPKLSNAKFHVAIGENSIRAKCALIATSFDLSPLTVISPTANVSSNTRVGSGSFLGPSSFLGPNASLGHHVILNTHAVVEHDSSVGSFCHLGPGSRALGASILNEGAFLGANSVVLNNCEIGPWSTLGALSFLNASRDVQGEVLVGTPARPLKAKVL